jgi:hypothetical protein
VEVINLNMSVDTKEILYIEEALKSLKLSSKGKAAADLNELIIKYQEAVVSARRRMIEDKPYLDRGYSNREAYLRSLSSDYNIDYEDVYSLASQLGRGNDFSGLVERLDDLSDNDDDSDD